MVPNGQPLSQAAAQPSTPTLLERLNAILSIEQLVERNLARLLDDPRLVPRFAGIDAATLERSQTAFLTAAFGGPSAPLAGYTPVHLDDEQFGRYFLHVYETLLSFGLSDNFTEQLVLAVMTRALSLETASELKAGSSSIPSTTR